MGNDTRLSDARKASDVHDWAKASTKPTYTASEVGAYTKEETDTKLNGKANSSHTHGNGDITSLDASKITSGTIDLARLPQGALDRLVKVADDTARFKLTTNDIQLGDTVQTLDNKKMYYVIDEGKLSSDDGYAAYTSGTAASVPWSGVTGKPSTYTPSSHTHTKSQITDFPSSLPANGGNAATVGGHTVGVNVPSNAKFTDTTYSKLSEFTDDVGYVKNTDARLSDARNAKDVYSWAKASSKPSYSKSEVGLGNVDNTADSAKSVKYATSAGSASSASKTTGIVDYGATNKTIQIGYGGSGITGDAIKFIAGYTTGNNSDVNAKIKNVSKDALKSWLGLGSLAYSSATIPTIPSSLPANGGNSTTVNGHTVNSNVPANAKFTDTNTWIALKGATTSAAGTAGYAPAPSKGAANRYLRSDGTWSVPPDTNTNTWRPVVNNLTSTATDQSLSAAQGKALNDKIATLNSSLTSYRVQRKTIKKTLSASYATISSSELGIGEAYILDVNISRSPGSGYHFVIGHGVDDTGVLFIYFDDTIKATVNIYIHYVSI